MLCSRVGSQSGGTPWAAKGTVGRRAHRAAGSACRLFDACKTTYDRANNACLVSQRVTVERGKTAGIAGKTRLGAERVPRAGVRSRPRAMRDRMLQCAYRSRTAAGDDAWRRQRLRREFSRCLEPLAVPHVIHWTQAARTRSMSHVHLRLARPNPSSWPGVPLRWCVERDNCTIYFPESRARSPSIQSEQHDTLGTAKK